MKRCNACRKTTKKLIYWPYYIPRVKQAKVCEGCYDKRYYNSVMAFDPRHKGNQGDYS